MISNTSTRCWVCFGITYKLCRHSKFSSGPQADLPWKCCAFSRTKALQLTNFSSRKWIASGMNQSVGKLEGGIGYKPALTTATTFFDTILVQYISFSNPWQHEWLNVIHEHA